MNPRSRFEFAVGLMVGLGLLGSWCAAEDPAGGPEILARPGRFRSLTEPPCSYASTQDRKGLIREDDRVVAWIRGAHNGGAAPLRHFLAGPRVINDTYGLFFYDPDGGYVSVFEKAYGFEFYGWRRGVMVARGPDGTLWSALSGRALAGPQAGAQLRRVPSLTTDWGHWLLLHPESTAYDLFDGTRYETVELPGELSEEWAPFLRQADPRLEPRATVLGVEVGPARRAYPLDGLPDRASLLDEIEGVPLAVFWYAPTRTAVAFQRRLGERTLAFRADPVAPESAPFVDEETGTRWTLAGRAVDGPLRGSELTWVPGVQCRWYAWASEHPATELGSASQIAGPGR